MHTLIQDFRYGVRVLQKNPGFTAIAVLTLALGIGANTAIFGVVNAVLLRPLPFKDPDRLAVLYGSNRTIGHSGPWAVCDGDYPDWKTQSADFGQIAAYQRRPLNITEPGDPERLQASSVDPDLFELLGVQPALGRTFDATEAQAGRDDVVVLAHKLWQRRFPADSGVIGKVVRLDGKAYSVIGVMPPGFEFPGTTDLWTPLVLTSDCSNSFNQVIARVKPDVPLKKAQEAAGIIFNRLSERHNSRDAQSEVTVVPLQESTVSDTRPVLLILLGAVSLVLLIACANVANLLLARAAGRQREIAIRRALGANRSRIVLQLLTESLILSVLGGALGVLFAVWGLDGLLSFLPAGVPRAETIGIDVGVLGFALAASVGSGIIFGLAPALHSSRTDLSKALKEGNRLASEGRRGRRVRGALVTAELALAIVLLISSGLLIQSFTRLINVDPGFDPRNLFTMNVLLPEKYSKPAQMTGFYRTAIERFRNVPGVHSVGAVFGLPFGDLHVRGDFSIEGQPPPPEGVLASKLVVSSEYFRAMGVPLIRGRFFTEADSDQAPPVVIVSRRMAEMFWPEEDPIGKQLHPGFSKKPLCTVIGVVGDVREHGFAKDAPLAIYMPDTQAPVFLLNIATFVVRTDGDPQLLANTFRREIQEVDRELPLFDVQGMNQLISKSISEPRFNMLLLTIFGGFALALASVGIYGVMAYAVTERTREMGIRIALGAQSEDVLKLVLKQGTMFIVIGVTIGLGAAYAATRVISKLLFAVSPTDTATFAGVAVLLSLVALLACYIPARRATKVDPMVALRYE